MEESPSPTNVTNSLDDNKIDDVISDDTKMTKSLENDKTNENAINDDDEFDQISDGTFEVDETSQATTMDDEDTAAKESANKKCDDKEDNKDVNKDNNDGEDGNEIKTNDSSFESKPTDFEEVDAKVPETAPQEGEEANMLGESDMTVPDDAENTNVSSVDKDDTGMDVDKDDTGMDVDEGADANADADKLLDDTEMENNDSKADESCKADDSIQDASEIVAKIPDAPNDEKEADKSRAGSEAKETEEAELPQEEEDNETVENVQEPEESDVCLIPDDNEVTDADKEQAILARENAEKECELAEQNEKKLQDENSDTSKTAEINQSLENNEEPLLEELHTEPAESGTVQKIIIGWIVSSEHECIQCKEKKDCGFRFKNPDNSTIEYLCEQSCIDAILASNPGKYFIRRKKFLVEELPQQSEGEKSGKDAAATDETGGSASAVDGGSKEKKYVCLYCKETKMCKYFFKQDDDSYYICNDNCFNMLTTEEPEKFKLKRHSIRVRNIGATTISSSSTSTDTSATAHAQSSSAKVASKESRLVARTAAEAEAARLERVASFTRRCAECFTEVTLGEKNLLWETMDFCNEICLGKYQRNIGSQCQTCHGEVPHQSLGKYCVRFGFDIRQFCIASCLNEYKKGLKTCSCCQRDISSGGEGFLAPVGDKEQFKDFCSQACMRRYDSMLNPKKKLRNDRCAVCAHDKPVRVEIVLDDKEHNFCSNPCFSAFKFVSNIVADQCGMCCKYFERKGSESFTIYTEKRAKVFCSRICLNVYIIVNRKIVSCQWCKVKKYNFDMIYKQQDNQEILMCSLNCLTLYGVSINAFSRTVAKCDNCNNFTTPQYHLTMSDASMRNFCTYQCVMQFQSQFARTPLTLDTETATTASSATSQQSQKQVTAGGSVGNTNKTTSAPFPTGLPKRVKLKNNHQQSQQKQSSSAATLSSSSSSSGVSGTMKLSTKNSAIANKKGPTVPVISTVSSLASGETENMIGNTTVRRGRGRSRKYVIDDAPVTPPPPPVAPLPTTRIGSATGRSRRHQNIDTRSPSPPPAPSPPLPPPQKSQKSKKANNVSTIAGTGTGSSGQTASSPMTTTVVQTETKILTVPPYPPIVRNVQTSCKPHTSDVSTEAAPQMIDAQCQTDKDYSNKVLIPVPVPIYIPQPMAMYSLPCPVPVPFPLPIPIPIFIPTTRNSAQGILKEIKKIQDKMPADPFEAELLMMAEMVAEEKDESNSDSDEDTKPTNIVGSISPGGGTGSTSDVMHYGVMNNVVVPPVSATVEIGNNSSYGEDVLQMALKMATGDYEEPGDLETAMTANTITNPPPGMGDDSMIGMHQMQQTHHIMEAQRGGRGRKRGSTTTPGRNNRSPVKRQRLLQHEADVAAQQQEEQQSTQSLTPVEKPDANMCLKYTFGVNAWKQWVMTKNADIEKGSIRRRTFKTDLLQMTADELNYSLCLFVKEVRKPNGTEYAPDTIYYLVLGIQQYLYESGRIDNIFTDPYYERFTDCLDEVARKFSVLYNDSQYIVTRVEEEHLWECKQLGAHSPHVLLSTLMFFNTKHFNLTNVEEHMQLSFSHIMKHWKRTGHNAKSAGTRNVLLRFYPPQSGIDANPRKKKVYEQQENEENPLRCPVRLYEFYLSKCPESVKTRNDVFYLQPERSCVPDSPVWYSTQALSQESLQKMLHRVKMVKEINIALLTS